VPTGALSVTTATALAAALAAAPVADAHGSAAHTSSQRSTQAHSQRPTVVTLLTGDRVLVRHDAAGRTLASLTPRSPHYGRPVEFVNTGTHTWVVPKLAPSVRRRFDASVFDVAALARAGRVPLKVTFAKGSSPRNLPGLQVRTSSARSAAGGRSIATASYDPRRPLPASLASALRGVKRISVAGTSLQPGPSYTLHTLTINGVTAKNKPIPGSDVFVFNADDSRLFNTFGGIFDGQWKVSVPSGHYFVIVSDFRHVVVKQVTVADVDTVADVSLGDATVKPKMTGPPGLSKLSPSLDILGQDDPGNGFFDFGWSGAFPKVSPLAKPTAGKLYTEVADLWSAKDYEPFTFHGRHVKIHPIKQVAIAKEVRTNIPRNLTFHYHQGDFAKVPNKHYAVGPKKQIGIGSWFGISKVDFGAFVEAFPTAQPGVVHAQYLGSKQIRWDSSASPSDDFRSFTEVDQTARYHRGQHAQVRFWRGPVTPVVDRGDEAERTGFNCPLCVSHHALHGFMSMMTAAGTGQFGVTQKGSWQLLRGRHRVSHGGFFLAPFARNPEPGQRFRLVATTKPQSRKQTLSSRVTDTWGFRVPSGQKAVVPILRAAYVPPTNLHSVGKAGHVSFPLTFDNLGPVDARVAKAALKWSVDGRHWHAADLTRTDKNTFRASYANPVAGRGHPYLSLRVTAKDRAGRSISETVEHAYLLPHGRTSTPHATHPQHRDRFRPGKLCRTSGRHSYSCFVKLSAATRAAGKASPDPAGWGAPALRSAYDLGPDQDPGTVAVVVAFDYPHAEKDMNQYRAQYGLPACTSASGCFKKINQEGETGNYPQQDYGWGIEASLDLQMISAACPTCHIVLVEANQPTDYALFHAEQAAVNAGATVTNHSFGRIELTGAESDALHFEHPGVTAVASTGDFGYGPASFPASSPNVVAVGGTVLSRSTTNPRGWREKAWRYAGSGCSAYFDKPVGQTDTACHGRTEADISAVARGLAIYNTSLPRRFRGWMTVDGTSASSPLIAGMIGSVGTPGVTPQLLYAHAGDFNDVVGGSNGFCQGSYMCTGVAGYDGPTGLGSPNGVSAFAVP
jgi:Subtilase family